MLLSIQSYFGARMTSVTDLMVPDRTLSHPDFSSASGCGTVVLECKDGMSFYARLPLLAEVSSVFRDMAETQCGPSNGSTMSGGHNTGLSSLNVEMGGKRPDEPPVIVLPDTSSDGLALALTIIRDTLQGEDIDTSNHPQYAYLDCILFAQTYDIGLVRRVALKLARRIMADEPLCLLALHIAMTAESSIINEKLHETLATHHVVDMPDWARQAIYDTDPKLHIRLLELQFGIMFSRTLLLKRIHRKVDEVKASKEIDCVPPCVADRRTSLLNALSALERKAGCGQMGPEPGSVVGNAGQYVDWAGCGCCARYVMKELGDLLGRYEKDQHPILIEERHERHS